MSKTTSSKHSFNETLTYETLVALRDALKTQQPQTSAIDHIKTLSSAILQRCNGNRQILNIVVDPLNERTLTQIAMEAKDKITLHALLWAGADITRKDAMGQTINDHIQSTPELQVTNHWMLRQPKHTISDFFQAIDLSDMDTAEYLLSQYPEWKNQFNDQGLNALHLAAYNGQFETMKVLIDKFGFDVNAWTRQHVATAVHLITYSGKNAKDILNSLASKGAVLGLETKARIDPTKRVSKCLKDCMVNDTPDGKF